MDAFEAEFAAAVGAPYALALASGTATLHLVIIQAGVGPGDEVITTPYTFAATAEVVRYFDARPVLVDVDSRDLNLDPARIEAAVTPRTRAIIPVHIAGLPAELDAIAAIAARHGLAVIEDAAHAFSTRYKGRLIGSPISAPAIHHSSPIIPHFVCFSFYATKLTPSWTSSKPMAADTLRRLLDLVASLAGLTVLSPLFVLIALLIVLDSPGPVFYRGQRAGRHGRLFRLYKFRSMTVGADRQGPGITAAGDARITRVGHFLRRAKLDELPQLINVLFGDMSLVGPRPEDPRYVAFYTPEQRRVLSVRPGITSPASLVYRHEEQLLAGEDWETHYRTRVLPDKLALDLAYLARRTLLSDLALILRTLAAVFA